MPRKRKNRKGKTNKPVLKPRKFYSTRQQIAVKRLSEIIRSGKKNKSITIGKILRDAGYSDSYSEAPNRIIKRKSFQEALDRYLPDEVITKIHGSILQASVIDHMTFPKAMSDKEIKEVIESIDGCKVRKIKHGELANHAYFWSPDNTSRLRAVAEAYKIKNKYPAEKHKIEGEIKTIKIINYGSKKG